VCFDEMRCWRVRLCARAISLGLPHASTVTIATDTALSDVLCLDSLHTIYLCVEKTSPYESGKDDNI